MNIRERVRSKRFKRKVRTLFTGLPNDHATQNSILTII